MKSSPDPESQGAALAGLHYVSDTVPGIERLRRRSGFVYRAPDGHWLSRRNPGDRAHLERIRALAVPPAYTQVWICLDPQGHLQATGRDARGRKQYRYHARWREARDGSKFEKMLAFGEVLPRLRRRVRRDLAGAGGAQRDRVLAALVRLLDTTLIRVGNQEYARSNRSYGLTTLRNRHVQVSGSTLRLRFKGKSGVRHDIAVDDPRVARIVRRCQALPGQELFQYEEDGGAVHNVGSADVNDYIRRISGGDFTAKDFRTWHASVLACSLLSPGDQALMGQTARTHRIVEVLREVATRLGNTVAVCRKSYVHPKVLGCATEGCWPAMASPCQVVAGLTVDERHLLAFLRAQ